MTKKLFAFSKPINYFLDMIFDTPVNVYAKEKLCFSLVNQCQLENLGATTMQDVVGLSMYDSLKVPGESGKIIKNDTEVMNKRGAQIFIEDATFPKTKEHELYFSVKTTLNDSANNIVGCFGISCLIDGVSLAKLGNIMNKLILMPESKISSIGAPPILNHYFSILTKREQECVYCLIKSMTYKEAGKLLDISDRTVEAHIEHVKNKLNCYSRSEIIDKVFDWKLTKLPEL